IIDVRNDVQGGNMGRERHGYVFKDKTDGKFYARVTYRDQTGKVRNVKRVVENKTEGKQLLKKLIAEIEERGQPAIDAHHLTFNKLADIYEERKLAAPVYRGDERVSGLLGHRTQKHHLETLREHFGSRRVIHITYSDLEAFKQKRLMSKTKGGTDRAVASV